MIGPPTHQRYCDFTLLRNCRQIYQETAVLPYQLNTFTIINLQSLKADLGRPTDFQREQIVNIRLDVTKRTGLSFGVAGNAADLQQRNRALLPALKRIHVHVFGPDLYRTQIIPPGHTNDCINKVREQLDIQFDTKGFDISFEEMGTCWFDHFKQ